MTSREAPAATGATTATSADMTLGSADLDRLGALHVQCIDDSLPALLGAGFAARLYAFLLGSESEHILCERVEGRIESAVVVSESPGDLQARIAKGTFPHLVFASLVALFTRASFWSFLVGALRDAAGGDEEPDHAPEITYVFTNPQLQGKKLGKRLIERVDSLMRERGIARYFVKTLDDPSNRAIGFYEREGFERIGVREEAGRSFIEFHKSLDQR